MRKKLAMLMASLFLVLGTAWADYRQEYATGAAFWSNLTQSENPDGVKNVLSAHATDGKTHEVWGATTAINVPVNGDVTVTFQYVNWSANHAMKILGVDIVKDGTVVASKYHLGSAGDTPADNAYTLSGVPVGDYTIRYFVCNRTDSDHKLTNTAGVITVAGANLLPLTTLDVTKAYRIKSGHANTYLEVVNFANTGEGNLKFKNKSDNTTGQFFAFEDAGNSKYHLKSLKEGTEYYITASAWNFVTNTTTTAEGFAVYSAGAGLYSFVQTYAKDGWGNDQFGHLGNDDGTNDGRNIYSNVKYTSLQGISWALEEVDCAAEYSALLAQAKTLSSNAFLEGTPELTALNAAIAAADALGNNPSGWDMLVTIDKMKPVVAAADLYVQLKNVSYITALDFTENSNHPVIVNNKRSNWGVAENATGLNTLEKLGFTKSETDAKQQFAFITPDGGQNYYLYSIHAQRYLKSDNTFATQGEPVAFADASSEGENRVQVRFKDYTDKYINVGGSNQLGIDWWNKIDEGNACEIVQYNALEFDLAYALRVFNEGADLTIKYMYGGELKRTEKVFKWKNDEFTLSSPWTYTSIESCTVGGNAISAVDDTWKFTVSGDAEVVVNLAPSTPFTISADFNSAAWHVMRIRPVRNGNEEFHWISKGESAPYGFSSDRPTTDAGLWAFVGNPIDGFKIYNKAAGSTMTLGVDGSNVVVKEGDKTWTVGKCMEGGTTLRGFYLYEGSANNYVHDYGNKFQIWNSTSAPTDGGSALVAYHPLTVKYMFEDAEVENLRVDTYVAPGSVYTITNSEAIVNDSKMIESCQVNGAYMEAVDGDYPVIVRNATTIIVTLKSSVSTARPVYALKSTTGTYLGLIGDATGLVANGVYQISAAQSGDNVARGYMAAGEGYTEGDKAYPVLSDITLSGYTQNKTEAITNGKDWYVYTNAAGTYIYNIGLGKFLANEWGNINFSDVPYAWTIKQNGNYTSIYDEEKKYLSMGCARSASQRPIQWETNITNGVATDGGAQHTFHAVVDGATTYATQIAAAQAAIAKVSVSFQETPLYLYYAPTADGAVFEHKDEPGKFLGFDEWGWNVINERSAWTIQPADYEGFAHIVRASDATKHLGSSENTNIGTGIYSNVGSTCNKWTLEGVYENYKTTTEVRDGKRHFTSEKLFYAGACNILRFTLTESSAYYEKALTNKRMSFDSFVLYDANGHAVKLTAEDFTGNNTGKDFSKMLDGVNSQCCAGTWGQAGAQDDWFEIALPADVDLGGAFSFSFVTENADMDAKAFNISMRYKSNSHKLNIVAPYGLAVTATYNGEAIAHGDIITGEFDELLLEIVAIDGYAHQVTVDEENRLVTVTFVQVDAIVNPAAVVALINRIGGTGTADSFKFVLDNELEGETFVIGAEDGKILIKGSTISAVTTGIGWYLNNIAHINIAWNSLNEKTTTVKWDENAGYADLSNLPLPSETETHTSDAKYRYYLNYCTFGYSMTSWTWTRWQQEIDWMALHGINMPLQIIGLEEVWRKFLTMTDANGNSKYNYSDSEAKAFVAGPAFTAWWGMNNLEGWGGTSADGWGGVQDDAWYERQVKLAKQITDLQRALGMQPVLPGFSGMVPTNFTEKTSVYTDVNGGKWCGFQRPRIIDPTDARFAEIAADYYDCLEEVMGESQYYSMDPFHEGGSISSGKYTEAYKAVYDAMEATKPGSQWVIQQWQWNENQKKSIAAVPAGRLIVLDLFSDGDPKFTAYNGYAPQDGVFCAIPNFGGRSGLMGRLQNVTDNYFKFKAEYPTTLKGIGTAPEAIEQTPVTYDLIYQLPWMNRVKPDVAAWVENYAVARYGKDNSVVKEAWSLLRQGPLNYGADAIQGPVEDVWAAIPNLNANPASAWGETLKTAGGTYTLARRQMLIDAVYKLIDQEDELALENGSVHKSNYLYDLVEFGGAVMADYAYDLLLGIQAAKNAAGANFATDATYIARRNAFLALIEDVDAFKGTNLNFRLGKWTQEARDAAAEVENAISATPDWYEFNNARTILTTWGDQAQSVGGAQAMLRDYSYRSWQGLMKDVYLPRWQHYFDNNCTTSSNYFFFSWNWAHGMVHNPTDNAKSNERLAEGATGYSYTRDPENKNTVEKAVEMLGKYIIPVAMADGTHYAYRYLTNDLSSKVTIIVTGSSIDLTKYFGALEGATVTGDFINGTTATDLTNIPLKADLDGAYTGTITLTDGTVLTFGVSVNPKYNGTYKIKYSGDPVFIQYHNVGDNAGNVGYKVVTTKKANGSSTGYSADYEADKIFTITPSGTGFALSAQGQYLKTTASSGWNHIMFSDQKGDAGTYTFTEAAGIVKLKSTANTDKASVAIFDNGAWGNDEDGKAGQFTLEPVTTYAVTIPEGGYYGICLPFNVVLPAGVTAYDVTVENLTCGDDGAITSLASIATEEQILKAGTPALLKGTAGNYSLTITMDNTDAKTSSTESKLRGNFVKQTLAPGILNKFIYTSEGAHPFVRINGEVEIPANTCWIEANIDADNVEVTEYQGKVLKIDDWLFKYTESANGSITLVDAAVPGTGDLVIGSYYTVNGKTQRVVAISPTFLHDNEELETVTLPATMTNLGFREVQHMFSGKYEGKEGDGVNDVVNPVTGKTEKQGLNRCFVFPNDAYGKPYKVSGNFAWKLTLDVTIDSETADFNDFGSSIVSTLPNSLADYYNKNMQIYMHKGHKNIVVKIDNNDDRYLYNTKVLDGEGNETAEDLVMTHFKFELEHDGAGGYQVVIYYENGKAKMYNISSSQQGTLVEFDRLYYSLPEGVHVDVSFDALTSQGMFVGCTNLKKIIVDPANPTFMGCDHGVLYDKNQYYVMRIPEGGGELGADGRRHFSIPSKVVKLYPGAIHGVDADIVLHSNPQIGVVKDHEEHVKNARFFLSLDDIDPDETVGGARDFISTNNNTYVSANYKRAPLAKGKYGTIVLPFVATNWKNKYDFFEMTAADATSFHFSPVVDELEDQKAYLYKLKDGIEPDGKEMEMENGLDVFKTEEGADPFTVRTHAKYNPDDEKPGDFRALGAYVNHYIDTEAANKKNGSFYYYYSIKEAQFLKVTKKLTYRPYRALFVVTPEKKEQAAQAPARFGLRILKRDGTTTEIDPSQIEGWEEDVYYDLQGRRVENPTQGIYIVNGKKVIVK